MLVSECMCVWVGVGVVWGHPCNQGLSQLEGVPSPLPSLN